jgi:hypothetical protein
VTDSIALHTDYRGRNLVCTLSLIIRYQSTKHIFIYMRFRRAYTYRVAAVISIYMSRVTGVQNNSGMID